MFDFLLLGFGILGGQFGAQVGFCFECGSGITIVLRFAGSDGIRLAGVVPLGAIVVDAEPTRHSQRGRDHQPS
jgi:hypothetical protein